MKLALCIAIGYLLYFCTNIDKQTHNPENYAMAKGYGTKKEMLNTLLSRIQWVNNYKSRINFSARMYFPAFLIAFMICSVFSLNIRQFVFIILLSWIILMSHHRWIDHHSDKFVNYYIDKNVEIIRKKLKLPKRLKKLNLVKKKHSASGECWNYIHR